jgi:hypothetical protein
VPDRTALIPLPMSRFELERVTAVVPCSVVVGLWDAINERYPEGDARRMVTHSIEEPPGRRVLGVQRHGKGWAWVIAYEVLGASEVPA